MGIPKSILTTSQIDSLPTAIGGKAKLSNVPKLSGSGFAWDMATRTLEVTKLPLAINLGLVGYKLFVYGSGQRSYHLWYRSKIGVVRNPKLGERPYNTADEMFDRALDWLRIVKAGGDPAADEAAKLQAQKLALKETVTALVPAFIDTRLAEARCKEQVRGILNRHVVPVLGSRPVKSITKQDCRALLEAIREGSGPAAALSVKRWLNVLLNWLEDEELIVKNVIRSIKLPPPKVRQRVFADAEYKLLWEAAGRLEASDPKVRGAFFKCLVMLGQRRNEVSEMRWGELNLDEREWMIPAERMKNRKPHHLPLPPFVVSLIQKMDRVEGNPYVFVGYGGVAAFRDFVGLKDQLLRAAAKVNPELAGQMPQWQLHDCRRSFRTTLAKLEVLDEIGERLLSHYPPSNSVESVYNCYDYKTQRAEAMRKFQVRLAEITGDPDLKLGPQAVSEKVIA